MWKLKKIWIIRKQFEKLEKKVRNLKIKKDSWGINKNVIIKDDMKNKKKI